MSDTGIIRECIAALEDAGCLVGHGPGVRVIAFPPGQYRRDVVQMSAWRFALLCQRVYDGQPS